MSSPSKIREAYPWGLAVTAFLAPLLGGQISLDPLPLEPGGILTALFREPTGATLAHALLFLPLAGSLIIALLRKSVVQVPHLRVVVGATLLSLFLLVSVGMSEYRSISLQHLFEWLAYLVALFAGIALAGRRAGPRRVVAALCIGSGVVALLALKEYLSQPDPTWRVIANWLNPNALAAMMTMSFLAGLGLTAELGRLRLVALITSPLCIAALILTQSKGGLLAAAVGGVLFIAGIMLRGRAAIKQSALSVAGIIAVAIVLTAGVTLLHPNRTADHSALTRVSNAGATQTQSSGFRRLLWQGSVSLIQDNPMGRGLGTYRFHSAKPGLTTQTHLAHQSYLQLGVEAGVGALLAFVGLLAVCLIEGLKGWRRHSEGSSVLRSGILASLGALAAHAMLDSDFSHFGLGLSFFLLLGLFIQLSSDGSVPEYTPAPLRLGAVSLTALIAVTILYFGAAETALGSLRYAILVRDPALAEASFDRARSMLPIDARVWSLGASLSKSPEERVERLSKATQLGPTTSLYRQLASAQEAQGDAGAAQRSLDAALRLDPNNLPALLRLLVLQKDDDPEAAKKTAVRLVEIEHTSYFKVRAIPEIVPLETFQARQFLAESLSGDAKTAMLLPAVNGYADFARLTVPSVVMFAKGGLDGSYGGITSAEARQALEQGKALCDLIEETTNVRGQRMAIEEALTTIP